jgi:uncharacterized protein (TIGR02246 family)
MNWWTKRRTGVAAILVVGCVALGLGAMSRPTATVQAQIFKGKKFGKKFESAKGDGQDQADDRAAIQKAVRTFLDAFEKGDAKAVAAHWTENGEYISDDGATFRGRAEIQKEYEALFAKKKAKVKLDIDVESIRFPSKDTAIEEGFIKIQLGKEEARTSKYTILHVREGGRWLMAVVREFPSEGGSIRELDWLIGTWSAKRDDTEVNTTYVWWGEKNFIRANFNIKTKDKTITGFQMIGKDASTGQIRAWAFDPDGSFGESTWTRDGKAWMQDSAVVLPDGSTMEATNMITRLDNDTFTFQSVERFVNGETLADIGPVRVTRVKGK